MTQHANWRHRYWILPTHITLLVARIINPKFVATVRVIFRFPSGSHLITFHLNVGRLSNLNLNQTIFSHEKCLRNILGNKQTKYSEVYIASSLPKQTKNKCLFLIISVKNNYIFLIKFLASTMKLSTIIHHKKKIKEIYCNLLKCLIHFNLKKKRLAWWGDGIQPKINYCSIFIQKNTCLSPQRVKNNNKKKVQFIQQ